MGKSSFYDNQINYQVIDASTAGSSFYGEGPGYAQVDPDAIKHLKDLAETAAANAEASNVSAATSATNSHTSEVNAAASAASAASTLAGALTKANNLSDLTNVGTAKTNLGLNNVDNTSDVNKPVSTAQQSAINLRVPLTYLDTDTALTANSDTKIATQKATKAAIAAAIAGLINSAPGALDTLNELAASLGNDPNFATTVTNTMALKLAISNNLSDLQNASTALTNLGLTADAKSLVTAANYAAMKVLLSLDQVDNTSDATKWAAAATLTNKQISTKTNSINGVQDDSNAAVGQIGEYVFQKNTTGVLLPPGVTQNIVSVTLGPGDWDVRTSVRYFSSGGATLSNQHTIISDQSATIPDYDHGIDVSCNPNTAGDAGGFMCGPYRYNVASGTTKTVYGIVRCTYGSGSITVKGIIEARRMR